MQRADHAEDPDVAVEATTEVELMHLIRELGVQRVVKGEERPYKRQRTEDPPKNHLGPIIDRHREPKGDQNLQPQGPIARVQVI